MANTDADAISGGAAAGGIFNLSDEDLIALVLSTVQNVTNAAPLLVNSGTVTVTSGETWGIFSG